MLKAILKTMRPRQWIKNVAIFVVLIFDRQLTNFDSFRQILVGFLLFCLISSCVYIINDIIDVEADSKHPKKCKRPIAAGTLKIPVAITVAIALVIIITPLSYLLSPYFALIILVYLILNLAYSKWLKHIPIVDVMVLASGFVFRVGAGVTLIQVERFSPWLYVVTTLGSLLLGFGKRRAELSLLSTSANEHRRVLDGYTVPFLDQLITIVSATTIMAYSLYTFSAPNLPQNHTMMLTIPLFIYGIFRYLYLVQVKHEGGAPEELFLKDRPLQITLLIAAVSVMIVFYLIKA